jgi:hypothetical protein
MTTFEIDGIDHGDHTFNSRDVHDWQLPSDPSAHGIARDHIRRAMHFDYAVRKLGTVDGSWRPWLALSGFGAACAAQVREMARANRAQGIGVCL